MPKIAFTTLSIQALKPTDNYVEYYEQGRKKDSGAFGIRVSPKGKKAWFVLYRDKDGKQQRYSFGSFPAMSLKQANATLSSFNIAGGGDPVAEKKAKKAAEEAGKLAKKRAKEDADARPTMKKLWKAYQDTDRFKRKVESTRREEGRKWDVDVEPVMGDMAVADVTPVLLADLLDKKAKKSPVAANRLHAFFQVLFKPAIRKGWIQHHPITHIEKPAKEKPRKRVLSDEEIKTLWGLLKNERENVRDTMMMMLLTAQRKGEIFQMHWNDIDLENANWNQQKNKTDTPILVPLSPQVLEIINGRQITDSFGWIFPSRFNESQHVTDVKKVRIRLNKEMGTTDNNPWTEHDLRRTARTLLSRLKIKHHVRERVLNHSQKDMEGVYDQYDYLDEKRDALEKLANEIDKIVGNKPKPQDKVVKLKKVG